MTRCDAPVFAAVFVMLKLVRAVAAPSLRAGGHGAARGMRTRAGPRTSRTVLRMPMSDASGSAKPVASKSSRRASPRALPTERKPIYIELSHLIPPRAGSEPQVVQLSSQVFDEPSRRDILHLCLIHYRDGLRQGSASTKTRGEVRGSGRKIRPQKGTGMARLGDGQSPMLVGGGRAFGPKPRDFSTLLPRKVRAMGMRVALSARMREQQLAIVETLAWPGVKTKDFAQRLKELSWGKCLFVTGCGDKRVEDLQRVGGNLPGFTIIKVEDLNIHAILRWDRLVFDVEGAEYLEKTWHPSAWFTRRAVPTLAPIPRVSESIKQLIAAKEFVKSALARTAQ